MGSPFSFTDLIVWQKSISLVKEVYKITEDFPKRETFGLTDQIRRAVVSVPSNIAEGKQRQSVKEYIQFLYIAYGSCAEIYTQLILAIELQYISQSVLDKIIADLIEIEKMLNSLIHKLKPNT